MSHTAKKKASGKRHQEEASNANPEVQNPKSETNVQSVENRIERNLSELSELNAELSQAADCRIENNHR